MKLTPIEEKIIQRMQPGVITLSGFLGIDQRHLHEIISEDEKVLRVMGKSPEEIAQRMEYLTKASLEVAYGSILLEDILEIETEVTRGKLPCPFIHKGIFRKTNTICKNLSNGNIVQWTTLNIHLIREHHFFEGKGSPYRLEPEILVKTIF